MLTNGKLIIFLGPPGSGKGTQAERLSRELAIPAISTGQMLRKEIESHSPLGRQIEQVLASGNLVGDDLINDVVEHRLRSRDCRHGCILDGYPRTLTQAQFLRSLLRRMRLPQPLVFDLELDCEEIVARLARRRQCSLCGRILSVNPVGDGSTILCPHDGNPLVERADDNPATIRERLRVYERNAHNLTQFYFGGDYHRICAARPADEITAELLEVITGRASLPQVVQSTQVSAHA